MTRFIDTYKCTANFTHFLHRYELNLTASWFWFMIFLLVSQVWVWSQFVINFLSLRKHDVMYVEIVNERMKCISGGGKWWKRVKEHWMYALTHYVGYLHLVPETLAKLAWATEKLQEFSRKTLAVHFDFYTTYSLTSVCTLPTRSISRWLELNFWPSSSDPKDNVCMICTS